MRRVELQRIREQQDQENIEEVLVEGEPIENGEVDLSKPFDKDFKIMHLANLKAHHFDINETNYWR